MERDKLLKEIGFSDDLIKSLNLSNERIQNTIFDYNISEVKENFYINSTITGNLIVDLSNENYAQNNSVIREVYNR